MPTSAFAQSLPEALRAHARDRPWEPWLFFPAGLDWSWISWGEALAQMEAWAARLGTEPADPLPAPLDLPLPSAWVLELARQEAGLIPPPEQARLRESALAVQASIQASGRREILVTGGPLEDPASRTVLAWATLAGTAVVAEPDRAAVAATAAWARPTVFHGRAEDLRALRRLAEEREGRRWLRRRRPRRPFGRLSTLLVSGPEERPAADLAFWAARGVHLARMP